MRSVQADEVAFFSETCYNECTSEKTGAVRVPVFSFFIDNLSQNMKQTAVNTIDELPAQPLKQAVPLTAMTLSSDVFYGVFLTLAIVITTLLYGNGHQIATAEVAVYPVINVRQMMVENRVHQMVTGYPIEQMTEIISKQNKTTAAFLIGIAKKESNWGKRVPVDANGADCFNYWGYRGAGSRGIEMGHGCFGSPEEAIGIVGGRLDTFVQEYKFKTAEEMVVWKCGWSCDGHSNKSVKKWIADVGYYTGKVGKR